MCNVMIADQNKITRQWLGKRIKSSRIRPVELILCDPADALDYMAEHDIDIVLTRIDTGVAAGIDFARSIKQKHLFTLVMGYGSCKDAGFLLKAMRNGISYYSTNIYNIKELMTVLNKVYEQSRRQKMEVKLRVEEEKAHADKSYTSGLLHEWTADFCRNAMNNNMEMIGLYIGYICEVMDKQSFLSSKRMIIELLVILASKLEKEGIDLPVLPIKEKDYHLIISMGTVDELKAWFRRSMTCIARVTGEVLTTDTNAHKLALAINYINNNYHRDISRDDVAGQVHLTPCYFSQFFKQQMGESFVEYLRRIRIERAKYLLTCDGEHLAEIYMKVGYNDSKYFAKVFREHTGYTPCEYRRMVTEAQPCAL